ncbi:(Fe-S)-binding protein [Oceanimonas baumannii]|uniref:(Fe-S)-binding protein n=1 Tax=Oceanimonas baumannii TaxID=129578 RepID=A0A235CKX1_9GAMM|nr:(Fe-S)-binding protein [Oceanimonas baumannii]MCC4262845.1 (Fe-S)-binding protein [Oceanimonas baumannii]OYD25004.1 (Fe-S)-binding protein [Oceanimonas baumannii]TDW59777.1 Fe-S oxidoreductase [Oceanimonas baumannii]
MFEPVIPYLLTLAFALAAIGALRRVRLWRRGQTSPVPFWQGLAAMPRRYLVDLHHVVARDKYMSNTHVATGGGFVLALVLVVLVHGLGLHSAWLVWPLLGASLLMTVGALFVWHRRRKPASELPNSRLSRGPWQRLPKSLLAFSLGFFIATLPATGIFPAGTGSTLLGLVLLAVCAWGLGELVFGMAWGGPMKHAFAGALHLAFHRRPARFGGGRDTGLKALDLSADKLGVEKVTDFKWNQLLGFDACVQCGRCESKCPAYAAGQPLNPKKLIQDMVISLAAQEEVGYRGSPHPGQENAARTGCPDKPLVESMLDSQTLWSCTTCRACVEECPMMIEHVDAVVDMRRYLTLERGQTPGKGQEVLENLIATDNPGGLAPSSRSHWAADLSIPLMKEVGEVDVLLWVGDGAFDMRNQRTLRALVKLLRAGGVDFAYLGNEELDSGDLARRLGDEATFQRLAKVNIQTLGKYRFNRMVTADPHSLQSLGTEYAELGGDYTVLHHSELLAELHQQGKLAFSNGQSGTLTYHDPCYLGRYNGVYDAPRYLLDQLGFARTEMDRSGFRSRCCGGGGGAPVTDIPGERRIADMRMDDARAVDAGLMAVACPQCTLMMEGVVEPRPEVKDIAELLLDALVQPATQPREKEEAHV